MANEDHVRRLKEGVDAWTAWRRAKKVVPDLSGVDLRDVDLSGRALGGANLRDADLRGANIRCASLRRTNLRHADLRQVDLTDADLTDANLSEAGLMETSLLRANLSGTDFTKAYLADTIFADVNLTHAIGLETCKHYGPSIVDHRTLERSGPLPLTFLRGVGLPDTLIDYLPSILNEPIQHYSCFISYSTNEQDFADRVHADLQSKGVRCWFATQDMRIGDKILDTIDSAIRLRDKVLLILSEHSINSAWVEDEVTKAFEEERKRGQMVLFPIRLDDAVMDTNEAWAAKLRARHIGDFRRWKEHDEYQKSFEHVLRDLTVKP
jgi:uncharacterized protein YjbI with pentapeptide repeats